MNNLTRPNDAAAAYTLQDWQGGHESLKQEYDYWIDQIDGEIPPDLKGTLFRNGPGLLDIHGHRLKHPFDGDGMVCAITFDHGRAHFRNRFVRTEGFVAEQAAGKILYRGVFGTQKPGGWFANIFDLRLKNIANTNVIYWGEKLLALWEADLPYRLDPTTLDTMGPDQLEGLLKPGSSFSAHPRIDPGCDQRDPRLVNFSVQPGLSTRINIYEFNLTGQVVQEQHHTIPGFAFIHDFAITPHFYIFFQNPIDLNPLPYVLGLRGPGECLRFKADQPTRIWLMPRDGAVPMAPLTTEACFVFHHANAYEHHGTLVVDSICYDTFPALDPKLDYREIDFATVPPGQLCRFQIDIATGQVQRQGLFKRSCEFPTVHPRHVGQPYQFLFLGAAHSPLDNAPLQTILKYDLNTGRQDIWSAAPHGFVSEPIFVPKTPKPRTHGPEDSGWLLVMVYDASQHRSQVVLLDAEQIHDGPIARLHLKHHVPYGLHGSFTSKVFERLNLQHT